MIQFNINTNGGYYEKTICIIARLRDALMRRGFLR